MSLEYEIYISDVCQYNIHLGGTVALLFYLGLFLLYDKKMGNFSVNNL